MARPISRGFPYFNLDSDIFYADRNIKALMGKYGIKVMCLYIYILCEVYRQEGYYCEYDDVFTGCAASTLNLSCGDVEDMLDGLLERALFDKGLFENKKVLTSHGIQKRFQEMSKRRGQNTDISVEKDLWLLSVDETLKFITCNKNGDCFANNPSSFANNDSCFANNPTKVKESKVNKSKVNESKEEESNTEAVDDSKHPYGEMENVLLTDEEFSKLKEKFPEDYQARIDALSFGISSKGYKYKSHYATIVRWANDEKKGESVKTQSSSASGTYQPVKEKTKSKFHNFEQREIDFDEIDDEYFAWVKGEI